MFNIISKAIRTREAIETITRMYNENINRPFSRSVYADIMQQWSIIVGMRLDHKDPEIKAMVNAYYARNDFIDPLA